VDVHLLRVKGSLSAGIDEDVEGVVGTVDE
jgi:hypothetical protein